MARGSTVLEVLVSVAIMMAVTGALFSLMNPAQGMFQAQPEASDLQQRLRVGVDALTRDLVMAGAGPYSGGAAGPLRHHFASILPLRRGLRAPDQPGSYHADRVSIVYVPTTPSQARVGVAMAGPDADILLDVRPGCPAADPVCGFEAGMTAVVFDETGAFDTFQITGVVAGAAAIQHGGQPLSKAYRAGAFLAHAVTVTYWLKTDEATRTDRLMRYDGYQSDLPIADHIVGLTFEYYGDPTPPRLWRPLDDLWGPWTSYGPTPPPPGVDHPGDLWGAGENCLFVRAADAIVPRAGIDALGMSDDGLVRLERTRLTDGPWCPDALSTARYDADLLRVRRIRVTLRAQTGIDALRGRGPLFARPGTSRAGYRVVPDVQMTFDVAPRNLNLLP